jgi:hypothetical protein
MIGRLDRAKDHIEMLCELGVTGAVRLGTDDMRPAFLGELHRATVDIAHRREDSHANAVLERLSFPFPPLTFGTRRDAPTDGPTRRRPWR